MSILASADLVLITNVPLEKSGPQGVIAYRRFLEELIFEKLEMKFR